MLQHPGDGTLGEIICRDQLRQSWSRADNAESRGVYVWPIGKLEMQYGL